MTPDDILRIARAVEPDTRWVAYRDRVRNWHDMTNVDGAIREIEIFDPLNSNDDVFRILVWLLAQNLAVIVGARTIGGYFPGSTHQWCVKHDGTEAGLRRAITEAAKRVTEAV